RICIPQGCILTGCKIFFGNRFYRAMQSCGLLDCSALHVTIIFWVENGWKKVPQGLWDVAEFSA
ncbi:MAG: hypothetical protein LBD59_02245, partial [Prevotellaceae bacterium]|nr:hypothetical protein [Prevotellaceae bacterium]